MQFRFSPTELSVEPTCSFVGGREIVVPTIVRLANEQKYHLFIDKDRQSTSIRKYQARCRPINSHEFVIYKQTFIKENVINRPSALDLQPTHNAKGHI